MELERAVRTQDGQITYTLVQKQIKNLNLRIRDDGSVYLSVPLACTPEQADLFVISRCNWIRKHLEYLDRSCVLLPDENAAVCRKRLERALERVYPLVELYGVTKPTLKIRTMRSQWGNCHWMQGYITLNRILHRCPEHLQDYVALHELIHFLHHNHGAEFHTMLDNLMPDWKERRRELKYYAAALRK